MNYERLKNLIDQKKLSYNKTAAKLGVSGTGFKQMIDNKTLRVDVLENICTLFGVPLMYFFNEDPREFELDESAPFEMDKESSAQKDHRIQELLDDKRRLKNWIDSLEAEIKTLKDIQEQKG